MTAHIEPPLNRAQLIAGALALVLSIVTVGFAIANTSLQQAAAAGQAKAASAQTAANVNASLIRMLAKSAAENNDAAIKALLAQNGITFKETPGATPPASPAPAKTN
ncbi:hypothetical protein [uncultured Sphingomonas sp.]|uniref:hypothetical protein n=1 Tax=uncultured Sphingomonas sp. TaxID=158754 RepID=UPI0035CC20E8